jgi:hypothetical protein
MAISYQSRERMSTYARKDKGKASISSIQRALNMNNDPNILNNMLEELISY